MIKGGDDTADNKGKLVKHCLLNRSLNMLGIGRTTQSCVPFSSSRE